MSTSVLLTDIVNERHQHRERLLALIAISSLVGWSVKKMTCLALIMTFSKSIPLLNIILMQTEICCGLCRLNLLQHHLNGNRNLPSEDWSPAGVGSLAFFECSAAQKIFQWGRIHTTVSLERSSRQIKAIERRRCVFLHKEQQQPLF